MFEKFIQTLTQNNLNDLTIRQYKSSYNRLARWFKQEGDTRWTGVSFALEQASELDIKNFKNWLTKNCKPSTVRQTLSHMRAYFDYLMRMGNIPENPIKTIDVVIEARQTPKWLNRNEQNALVRATRKFGNIRELAIITVFLHTGLRVDELSNVLKTDVIIKERSGLVIVRKGKYSRYREVPLNKDVRDVLTKYLDKTPHESPYLFKSERGDQLCTRGYEHIIEKYKKLTEIENLTLHALRHTFGHELIVNKTPMDVVARLLGHMKKDGSPNIDMVLVYTTPGQADLQNAVESLSWK